jgi:hypothetical protein
MIFLCSSEVGNQPSEQFFNSWSAQISALVKECSPGIDVVSPLQHAPRYSNRRAPRYRQRLPASQQSKIARTSPVLPSRSLSALFHATECSFKFSRVLTVTWLVSNQCIRNLSYSQRAYLPNKVEHFLLISFLVPM